MSTLLKTSLYDEHKKLNATMVCFGGWDMPVSYSSSIQEYQACRNDVAVFDTSHMGNFVFKGDIKQINQATTIDVVALANNKCKYGFLLNEKGGVIDDLIIYKFSDTHLFIVVNAATCKNDFDVLSSRLDEPNALCDVSANLSKIDIQGPNSIKILQKYFKDINLSDMAYFSFKQSKLENEDVIVSRTGYTGELGFEVYLPNSLASTFWQNLLKDNATPCGLASRDMLRLEMGYSLYSNELTQEITPLEASLDMFVNLSRDFIGKNALVKQKETGLKRKIYPFVTNTRRVARKDFKVYQNDKEIGYVTSGGFSPALVSSIGLAMINLEDFSPTDEIVLVDEKTKANIKAQITTLPFLKR